MSESDAIARGDRPSTVMSLRQDLRAVGVSAGDIVIVHTSMARLGWVAGGAQAIVEALLAAVASAGTVVMPTQSGHLSDPVRWSSPPVPRQWVELIRRETPAFDRALTPTREMGQVVECFRHHPSTVRSGHPIVSFAANGPHAEQIVSEHPLTPSLGETSPLGRLYDLDAKVLLLGVGHSNNTALHLAEHRATWPGKHTYTEGAPVVVDGFRRWVTYEDLEPDDSDFDDIGTALADAGHEHTGPVGAGVARMCAVRSLIDFAADWMTSNRK